MICFPSSVLTTSKILSHSPTFQLISQALLASLHCLLDFVIFVFFQIHHFDPLLLLNGIAQRLILVACTSRLGLVFDFNFLLRMVLLLLKHVVFDLAGVGPWARATCAAPTATWRRLAWSWQALKVPAHETGSTLMITLASLHAPCSSLLSWHITMLAATCKPLVWQWITC